MAWRSLLLAPRRPGRGCAARNAAAWSSSHWGAAHCGQMVITSSSGSSLVVFERETFVRRDVDAVVAGDVEAAIADADGAAAGHDEDGGFAARESNEWSE